MPSVSSVLSRIVHLPSFILRDISFHFLVHIPVFVSDCTDLIILALDFVICFALLRGRKGFLLAPLLVDMISVLADAEAIKTLGSLMLISKAEITNLASKLNSFLTMSLTVGIFASSSKYRCSMNGLKISHFSSYLTPERASGSMNGLVDVMAGVALRNQALKYCCVSASSFLRWII